MKPCTFQIPSLKKNTPPKKFPFISGNGNPKKASYISRNGTFQSTLRKLIILQETETLKKFLLFSQKKDFLIFWEKRSPKHSLYFRKQNFLIFQETLKKLSETKKWKKASYISGGNLQSLKMKNFLYFLFIIKKQNFLNQNNFL